MNKVLLRFLAIVVGILVIIVALAAIILPLVIPTDKIKTIATTKASEFLQRPVTIQKASFNLFTGVELTGVTIGERKGFSTEPFVSMDSAQLRANLLMLIFGKISLDGIKIVHPLVKIERNADNLSNYQDILDRFKGNPSTPPKPLPVVVHSFELVNGDFKLIEHFRGKKDQIRSFNSTNIKVENLSSFRAVPAHMKTLYVVDGKRGVPMEFNAQVTLDQGNQKLALHKMALLVNNQKVSGNFELVGFSGPQKINFDLNSDKLDIDKVSAPFITGVQSVTQPAKPQPLYLGFPKTLSLKGKLDLSKITLSGMAIDKIAANIKVADQKVAVDIKQITITGTTISGSVQGDVRQPGEPNFSAQLNSSRLDLSALGAHGNQSKPQPEGELTRLVDKISSGIPENLKFQANVNISKLTFKKLSLNQFSGYFFLKRKILSSQISLTGYQGSVTLNPAVDFRVSGLAYSIGQMKINHVESKYFINDGVESFMVPPESNRKMEDHFTGALSGNFAFSGRGVEMRPLLKNLQGNGHVGISNGTLKKIAALAKLAPILNNDALKGDIAFSEFKGDFSIANGVMTVSPLAVNAEKAGLKAGFTGKLDLVNQRYLPGNDLKLTLSAKDSTFLPSQYMIFKDPVTGITELDFELTGPLDKPVPVPKMGKPVMNVIEKQIINNIIPKPLQNLFHF